MTWRIYDAARWGAAALATVLLTVPTVLRTEYYPSVADVWRYTTVAFLPVLAVICLWGGRRVVRMHVMDAVAAGWWAYVAFNYWFLSPYPAAAAFREATALLVAYLSLRVVIPFCGPTFGRMLPLVFCLSGGYEACVGIFQLAGAIPSRHPLFALTGTFFNPGPYSFFPAMTLAVSIAWLHFHKDTLSSTSWNKVSGMTAITVALICLPALAATWSRAAWLALAIAAAVLFYHDYRHYVWGGAVLLCLLGTGVYFLKPDSADGRMLMACVSAKAGLSEWLSGHGIGGFAHAYAEAQRDYFSFHPDSPFLSVAGCPDTAFNDLLTLGVEQGLPGMTAALVLCLWSMVVLLRRREALAYGMLVLLAASLFSYPFTLQAYRLVAVGWVAYTVSCRAGARCPQIGRRLLLSAGEVALAVAAVAMVSPAARLAETYASYSRLRNVRGADFLDYFYECREELKAYPDFLFTFGKALQDAGRYNDSNAVLEQGTMVSGDPMFHVLMGNNYRMLDAVPEAEEAYRRAFGILPNRLYPLYRLMKLYEETRSRCQAKEMADSVARFRPKVVSSATRKMQEEAREILRLMKDD